MKNLSRSAVKKCKRLGTSLIRYIHLQLFLTTVSLPILVAWGLPCSYASIVGNLLFAPFLTIFLFLSSLIFFCELATLPNQFFIYLLEVITTIWTTLLSYSDRSWLFYSATPPSIILIFLPIAACLILQHKRLLSPTKNSCALLVLLISYLLIGKAMIMRYQHTHTLPCFDKELTIMQQGGNALVIDQGALGRRVSASSWIHFTFIPFLAHQGICQVTLICSRPSFMTFQALSSLIDRFEVEKVLMPAWKGSLKNTGWSAYEKLLRSAEKYGTKIEMITKPHIVHIDNQILRIEPDKKTTKKNNLAYKALLIKY